MNNKQERIRIEQFEYEGFGHCGGFSTDGEGYYCEFGVDTIPINKEFCEKKCPYDSSISRQEAIDKISMVLFELNSPTSWIYENAPATLKEHYKNQAEKILNKILEK